jgi:hypothetical protein
MKDAQELLDEVKHAHTNLYVFMIIKAVLESGALHGAAEQGAAIHIGRLCDAAIARQLQAHDKAKAELMKEVLE